MPRNILRACSLAVILLVWTAGCSKEGTGIYAKESVEAEGCANQLKMFDGAKKLWAAQNDKTTNDTPVMADLLPFIRCHTNCPGGGAYTLGKVGELPACSVPQHQAAFLKKMQPPAAPSP